MDKTIDASDSLYILICTGSLPVNYNEVNQEPIHFLFLGELHSTVVPSKTVEVDLTCHMPVSRINLCTLTQLHYLADVP